MSKTKKAPTRQRRAVLHQLEENRYFVTSRAAQPGQGMTMPGICRNGLEVAKRLKIHSLLETSDTIACSGVCVKV